MKTEAERTALKRAPDAKATGERHRNPILRFLGELPGLVIMALVLAICAVLQLNCQLAI